MEQFKSQSQENKIEHLEGVKPIVASLETVEVLEGARFRDVDTEMISLYEKPDSAHEKGYIKNGNEGYIISGITDSEKMSFNYAECTGVAVVGIDIDTGENISFLTHQNPSYFLKKHRSEFIQDMRSRLLEVKERCKDGTIDATIFGGRYAYAREYRGSKDEKIFIKEYVNSVKLLGRLIDTNLGFSPTVIVTPKFNSSFDAVVFDTENRRLYLTRDKGESGFMQSFKAKDVDNEQKKWDPGEWSVPI